jgi:hypothetical protein
MPNNLYFVNNNGPRNSTAIQIASGIGYCTITVGPMQNNTGVAQTVKVAMYLGAAAGFPASAGLLPLVLQPDPANVQPVVDPGDPQNILLTRVIQSGAQTSWTCVTQTAIVSPCSIFAQGILLTNPPPPPAPNLFLATQINAYEIM